MREVHVPDELRTQLADAWGVSKTDIDRVAVALALAESEGGLPDDIQRVDEGLQPDRVCSPDDLDAPFEAPVFAEVLSSQPNPLPVDDLLGRGLAMLARTLRRSDDDPLALLGALLPGPERRSSSSSTGALEIEIGVSEGACQRWAVNREAGTQNNPNLRLAGMPGTGKSQFLLHLLAALSVRSSAGFLLFDYKGDLASNAGFLEATGARPLAPGRDPIPLNPFQLPQGTQARLAPRVFAGVFASAAPNIGEVQKQRLSRAFQRALSSKRPSLAEVGRAVHQVYAEEGAKPDTVTGLVEQLVSLGIFSDRGPEGEELFAERWVVDLASLQDQEIQQLVAFVLLQYVQNVVQALPDAAFDGRSKARRLRGIVAVDEAHYYLERRCTPLLQLIRTARSKGVPVFLSSQSLNDFRHETELNEFLPNTWLFRHGMHPSARILQGALGLGRGAGQAAADRLSCLEQFHVLGPTTAGGAASLMRTHSFFEGRYR